MVKSKTNNQPYLKIHNIMSIKTVIPFWLNTIHPPLQGKQRETSFLNIVKDLNNQIEKTNNNKDIKLSNDWFISEDQFASELPLSRHILVGNKINISDHLKTRFWNRFKEVYSECYQIENELYEIQADLNSINAYYFSYGIGFVKISTQVAFTSKKIAPDDVLMTKQLVTEVIQSFLIDNSFPPFSSSKDFEQTFVDCFSKHSKNEPYQNWLLAPLDRDNITLDHDVEENSFVELFVTGKDSEMGKKIVQDTILASSLEDKMLDWSEEDDFNNFLEENEFSDIADDILNEWDILYQGFIREGYSEEDAKTKADETLNTNLDEELDPETEEEEEDLDIIEIDDDLGCYLDSKQFFDIGDVKSTTFKTEKSFIKWIDTETTENLTLVKHNEADNFIAFASKNGKWQTGDPLISFRYLDENKEYFEDDFLCPYFYFKTTTFACLQSANLGLYANLFKMDKTASLKPRQFSIENNGFLRARNLLDILRFESSYEIIRNESYKMFHDCEKYNIDRVVSKNEKIFNLIEQRLTGEKAKQEKTLSDAITIGLAVISILTVGLAAADITNFLGFKDVLSQVTKALIITIPVLIFLFYLRLYISKVKKLDKM